MTGMIVSESGNNGGETAMTLPAYRNVSDPMKFCETLGKSLQVTFNLTSPHHGTVMALTCMAENIPPTIYNQRYHGDGTMRASAIQARFMERKGRIEWKNLGDDGKEAVAVFYHPTQPQGIQISYTIEDAKRQVREKFGKDGSNWQTNPGSMLRAALIRKGVKIIDPGVIGGFDEFDEFSDDRKPVVSQSVAADTQAKSIEARRAELLAGDVVAESAESGVHATEAVVESPAVEQQQVTETPPFETTAPAAEDDGDQPATNELLQEIAALGKKMPSKQNPGSLMEIQEISEQICGACRVDSPKKATRRQIRTLIERMRVALSSTGPQ